MTSPASSEREEPEGADKQVFVFPTSFAQQRLWFLHQFEPLSSAYNIPAPLRLNAPLDRKVLAKSFQEIVRRHESLRTTFTAVDGEPMQVVAPSQTFNLEYVDLRSLPAAEREAEAYRLAALDAQRPFSLTDGPLLCATLLQLGSADHVLLLTMHHIVSDGWSMGVLIRELSALYAAYAAGRASPLAELPIQYADFALWQRQLLRGEFLEGLLSYWKNQLAGAPALLQLPTDRPRPAYQTYRGAVHNTTLEPRLYDAVRALGQAEGATTFMVLLAAFQLLLSRYSGALDLAVGTPIAGRTRPELEGLIGFFVNTLVLRADLSGDPSFRELLGRAREATLGAYAHQELPFEKLVEELAPERDLSRNPLFQVLFIFQGAEGATASQPAETRPGSPVINTGTAKFDLTLCIGEVNRAALASFEYNTDLFDQTTVERMAAHFEHILRGVVRQPGQRLSELTLLTEAESRQLVTEWNRTKAERGPAACVHEMFEAQAARTPQRVAVEAGGRRLTYRELDEDSNRLARYLRRLGVGAGSLVGICLERSTELPVALLGVLKAGAAYVPLDPSYPRERLRFMIGDAGLRALLTEERFADLASELGAREVVSLEARRDEIAREDASSVGVAADFEGTAYVIYTSGSTGRPKGVMIPHRALYNLLASMRHSPGLSGEDVLLAVTTLSFDIAGLELFLPLVVGARLIIAGRDAAADARRLTALLRDTGANVMQATPSTWQMLLDAGWTGNDELKILCGGEALARDLADELLDSCGELWNVYGPTETTIWSMSERVRAGEGLVSIGRPIDNTRVYLLDSWLRPVPVGVVGELYIGGDGLAHGYLKRPALTAERFVPDPFGDAPGARLYQTGDLARYRTDGRVEFLGRADHQVKVRGHRIELGEIEAALRQQAGVREALVVVREDAPGDQRLVAYLVVGDGADVSAGELRIALKARLPDYLVPSHFVTLDALPLLPNGKLDRRSLPPPDASRFASGAQYVAPRDAVEQQLARLLGELLGRERVGAHDDFFELGGHSLLAMRVLARIQEAHGAAVPLRRFFESPTVAGLALAVAEARQGGGLTTPAAAARVERCDEAEPALTGLSDSDVESLLSAMMAEGREDG